MSATLAQLRAAIVAAVRSVPDVGAVHDRERYARDDSGFRSLYVGQVAGRERLAGWWLRRTATAERSPNVHRTVNVHTWQLRGYFALADDDGSELLFDDRIEAIRAVFRDDPTLGGISQPGMTADGDGLDGVQVVDAGPVMFAGVLCHSAVLSLKTWSYL